MSKARPENKEALEQRVVRAAEAALASQHYVSAIDILTGMGLLATNHVEAWRKGRIDSLERMIQGRAEKISFSMGAFRRWAEAKGLQSSEASYVLRTRSGIRNLQFTESGDHIAEKFYSTHFVSPELSERKRKKLEERVARPAETVVFQILRDSKCSECGAELFQDNLLTMEGGEPLCLACARLDDLEFLAARRGSAAQWTESGRFDSAGPRRSARRPA